LLVLPLAMLERLVCDSSMEDTAIQLRFGSSDYTHKSKERFYY
jgi:hypothetical protein